MNRSIEIHDSVVERVFTIGVDAVIDFSRVYIHQSPGKPGFDAGSGWVQRAQLRIKEAAIQGAFSQGNCDLSGGHLKLNGTVLDNEIPIPLDFLGGVELGLKSHSGVVLVAGNGAELEVFGEPEYVEEFDPT